MSRRAKILFLIGFVSAFLAYSIYPYLWDKSFYHLTALSFVGYAGALYFQTKGGWSLVVLVAFMSAINAFIDELFFNPTIFESNEYVGFLTIILVVLFQRRRWRR